MPNWRRDWRRRTSISGAVYYEKKDYGNAIPPLRKALELNPDLPGAHGMLGVALLALGYAAESIPHLEKAQADALLGVALLESGREREAMDRLEAALAQAARRSRSALLSEPGARTVVQAGVPGSGRAQSGFSADAPDAG